MSAAETIKDVATKLGVWRGTETRIDDFDSYRVGWHIMSVALGYDVWFRVDDKTTECNANLTEAETLLLLSLLALPPDRKTCPDCKGRTWTSRPQQRGSWSQPCPSCKGPNIVQSSASRPDNEWVYCGRDESGQRRWRKSGKSRGYVEIYTWVRHFIGALPGEPVFSANSDKVTMLNGQPVMYEQEPGDPEDRDAIAVFADQLQTGDGPKPLTADDAVTLGKGLALWLTQAPCMFASTWREIGHLACPPRCAGCDGSGLALDTHVSNIEAVVRRLTSKQETSTRSTSHEPQRAVQ